MTAPMRKSRSGDHAGFALFGTSAQKSLIVISTLLAIKVALFLTFALHSRFVMDEFGQLGYAKYLGRELFDTIWPAKSVGFQLFVTPAFWIGRDAVSTLLIGRLETALLSCATLAIIYAIARRLGENRVRALTIVLVVLCFSNFIERSFRTIAEPVALFWAAASLLLALRGGVGRPATIIGAGILAGLSFLTTQKAVYFNVALGLALVGDAMLARSWAEGLRRGLWIVTGWVLPVLAYCILFGGTDPMPVFRSLVFGPVEVASGQVAAEYGGLRGYVWQTFVRNGVLYLFGFAGMSLKLRRFGQLDSPSRVAIIFSLVITALVFVHNQPWPYVFIMAIPFVALWVTVPFDTLALNPLRSTVGTALLGIALITSFIRNIDFLRIDNRGQLSLVGRAEASIGKDETYFDGIDMVATRNEPSTLWLDRHTLLATAKQGIQSEAYRIFRDQPPKVIIWSYRMDSIEGLLQPLIRDSYVQVAPNIRLAGRRLGGGRQVPFNVPIAGQYALYGANGHRVDGTLEIASAKHGSSVRLARGAITIRLADGPDGALLLLEGQYAGLFMPGDDDPRLFDDVYS